MAPVSSSLNGTPASTASAATSQDHRSAVDSPSSPSSRTPNPFSKKPCWGSNLTPHRLSACMTGLAPVMPNTKPAEPRDALLWATIECNHQSPEQPNTAHTSAYLHELAWMQRTLIEGVLGGSESQNQLYLLLLWSAARMLHCLVVVHSAQNTWRLLLVGGAVLLHAPLLHSGQQPVHERALLQLA